MRGGKRKLSGIITIKIDYDKEESSSGDGRRFFFLRVRGVSEWSERGRTGAQEVNGGCLEKRTEGVLRVRERMGGLRGIDGEIARDMEEDGASCFWETVPKAGRFFCAIVGL